MTDFYVQPKSTGYTGGNGSSPTNAFSVKQAYDAIEAGTIKAGDRVAFCGGSGIFTLADRSEWPSALAANGLFASGEWAANMGGICFGQTRALSSKASGIWFDGRGDGAQSYINMSGGRTAAERQVAAIRWLGEDIRVTGFKIRSPDYDYVTARNINAPGGSNQPETLSYENIGLYVFGNGNTIEDCQVNGSDGFGTLNAMGRYGILANIPNDLMGSSYSRHKRTTMRRNTVEGFFHNFRVDPSGSGGYVMRAGTELLIEDNVSLNPQFGRRPGAPNTDPNYAYNAAVHGGHASIAGRWLGRAFFLDNTCIGMAQDGIDAIGMGISVNWNTFKEILGNNVTALFWDGANWTYSTPVARSGTAIKLGLGAAGAGGTPPTSWMGTDGVRGGSFDCIEDANRAIGNKIYHTTSGGITGNGSGGHFIAYNEICDTEGSGILCYPDGTKNGTYFVLNNYVRLAQTNIPQAGCLDTTGAPRIYQYNNIFDSGVNAAARNAWDWNQRATSGPAVVSKKNVYVNGRKQFFNSSVALDQSQDINAGAATSIAGWVDGQGFPLGHALQGLADAECLRTARSAGMMYDANRKRIFLPNNLGPYTRPGV